MASFLGEGNARLLGIIVVFALAIPLTIVVELGAEWAIAQYALLIVHSNSATAVWLASNIDKAALHVLSFFVAAFIVRDAAAAVGRRCSLKESSPSA